MRWRDVSTTWAKSFFSFFLSFFKTKEGAKIEIVELLQIFERLEIAMTYTNNIYFEFLKFIDGIFGRSSAVLIIKLQVFFLKKNRTLQLVREC